MDFTLHPYQISTLRAFISGLPNAICRTDLALKPKNHPTSGLVKAWYCKKKFQYCYNTIANLQWYCSSIAKPNNNFLFFILPYIYASFSLFTLSHLLSFSGTFLVSSLSTVVHSFWCGYGSNGVGRDGGSAVWS